MQNKTFCKSLCLFLTFLLTPNFVFADEQLIEAGKKKAAACAACHGISKSNNPEWPNLSQQSTKYLDGATLRV